MKKIKSFAKNNIKIVVAFVLGLVVAGGTAAVVYAVTATQVGYTDTNSIGATTVQGAIDKLYDRTLLKNRTSNYIEAYTYNQTSGAANYCITGNESTCVATTCYKTKSADACSAGTIIRYQVKPGLVETFHVMYDDASTITMQLQRNIMYNVTWFSTYGPTVTTNGPTSARYALIQSTNGWVNANDQTYTMGTTVFKKNAYTGCNQSANPPNCTQNIYTWDERVDKARLITIQEATTFGCQQGTNMYCPKWMYNYLDSTTNPDNAKVGIFLTMDIHILKALVVQRLV